MEAYNFIGYSGVLVASISLIPQICQILKTKKETAATAPPPISPAQRAYNNMIETVHADWDDKVVDSWIDGSWPQRPLSLCLS